MAARGKPADRKLRKGGGATATAESDDEEPPEIDRSIEPHIRVRTYLEAAGPTKFQTLMRTCGLKPAALSDVLNEHTRWFEKQAGNFWALKPRA